MTSQIFHDSSFGWQDSSRVRQSRASSQMLPSSNEEGRSVTTAFRVAAELPVACVRAMTWFSRSGVRYRAKQVVVVMSADVLMRACDVSLFSLAPVL